MKKIFFYTMAVAVILATACNKDDETGDIPEMTMTTQQTDVTIRLAGSGTASIDWGDKTAIEIHSITDYLLDGWQSFTHVYSDASAHTIVVTGNNIKHMSVKENGITRLDVSRNSALGILVCNNNFLKNLDIRSNSVLEFLSCIDNELTDLDVSKNTELWGLGIDNNHLTKLDISKNSKLTTLGCSNNFLKNLDVSSNTALVELYCNNNELTDLDVSRNIELTRLYCYKNHIMELDVGNNNIKLYGLMCENNNLSSEALNTVFGALHNYIISKIGKAVYIGANPGTDDCNISVAENKGWTVLKYLLFP